MSVGTHTYAATTPSSPSAIQNHFLGEVFKPVMRDHVNLARFSKKQKITGLSYNLPSYKKMDIADSVERANENSDFRAAQIEMDGKSAELKLQGEAIRFNKTLISRNQGVIDVLEIVKSDLRQSMALQLDKIHKAALDGGNLIFTPTGGATQQIDTNGTASQSAANNMQIYHFQYLSLLANDVYAIKKVSELGCYAYITRGRAVFHLRRDPEYRALYQGVPSYLQKGHVAQVDDIKIFETNEEELYADNLGTSSNVAEGSLLGDEAMHMFFNKPFEIFVDMNETAANFYGTEGTLWYKADLGVMLPTNSIEKRRVRSIRITSA